MDFSDYHEDRKPPYTRRVVRDGYDAFDPAALPWMELRANPKGFEEYSMAKLSSVRMVLSTPFTPEGGDEQRIFVKRSLVLSLKKRLGEVIRSSKEWREFNLAIEFRKAGLHVPLPVYYSEMVDPTGVPVRFFATLSLERDWRSARKCFKENGFGEHWRRLASFTRELHRASVLHGDYRSDHIYMCGEDGEPGLNCCALIDLDGSRIAGRITRKERVRSLRQLAQSLINVGLTRRTMGEFLAVYDPNNELAISAREVFDHAREKHEVRMLTRAQEVD